MKDTLENVSSSAANIPSSQFVMTNPTPVEPPSAWMRYGTSPTEIILATAVVIGAIAGVIGSLAFLLQVLVPVMQKSSSQPEK